MVSNKKIFKACEILHGIMSNHPEWKQPSVEFKPELVVVEKFPISKLCFFLMNVRFTYGGRIFSISKNDEYAKHCWCDFTGKKELSNMAKDAAMQAGINPMVKTHAWMDIDEIGHGYVCVGYEKKI